MKYLHRLIIAIIALLALMLIAAGCCSRAAPGSPVVNPPADPIHMTARELYSSYNSSSRVIPVGYETWDGIVWTDGGGTVSAGITYILPVPTVEGIPNAELIRATESGEGWLLGQDKTSITLIEDTTYSVSNIKFWKLRIDSAQLPDYEVLLHCFWAVHDVNGELFTFSHYYRLAR